MTMTIDTLLKPEQINAKYLKKELIDHLYWRLNYTIVIDEYKFMDVFGVRRNGYCVEFEIKISKSDLCRELNLMNCEQPMKWSKDWPKWEKHSHYLNRRIDPTKFRNQYALFLHENLPEPEFFMPNEFYFYVPDFLADFAAQATANTPYGVIKIGKTLNGYDREYFWRYTIVKKAVKLHNNKMKEDEYKQLAHALTIRNRIFHDQK